MTVDDRVMSRISAFVRFWISWTDLIRSACLVSVYAPPYLRRIGFRGKTINRYFPECRIAEIPASIGIGELHRFRRQVDRRGTIVSHCPNIKCLQNIEYLNEMNTLPSQVVA